jgi:hypothetical protein
MEPEGLLSCSQKPDTGPYPEPVESTAYRRTLFKIHFNIIFPSMTISPSSILPSCFQIIFFTFLVSPSVLHVSPNSPSWNWSPSKHSVKSTNYEVLHYLIFSILRI